MEERIAIEVFCRHEGVEPVFVRALHQRGLIVLITEKEEHYITHADLPRLEQLVRMHYDLDINLEGIEAISHMLERVEDLQREMRTLRERLRLYEPE